MLKDSLVLEWKKLTPAERQEKILEIEKWLLYRSTGKWFETVAVALLQEIYHLREQIKDIEESRSQDP